MTVVDDTMQDMSEHKGKALFALLATITACVLCPVAFLLFLVSG